LTVQHTGMPMKNAVYDQIHVTDQLKALHHLVGATKDRLRTLSILKNNFPMTVKSATLSQLFYVLHAGMLPLLRIRG
jgi:hypothetical protein